MKRSVRLEDLAALADVSIATVSRALNDSPAVNEATKRRIWQIARDNDYAFRPHMPAMLTSASKTVGVVIPTPQGRRGSLADPFFLELLGGIGEAARDAGCDMMVSHIAPKNYDDLSGILSSSRAEGVIFLGQSFLHERFNRLAEQNDARFVVWGAALPGQRYCSVGSDNIKGGRRAASHLARLGRRRIAFLGDTEAPEVMQRYQGYLQALDEAGLPEDPSLVAPAHFEIESAESAIDQFVSSGVTFDAVVAASDQIALGAIRGAMRSGLRVPDDICVVGYDDIQLARYSQPALTTISQDVMLAGRLMLSKVQSLALGHEIRSERLPTELIVRESCSA